MKLVIALLRNDFIRSEIYQKADRQWADRLISEGHAPDENLTIRIADRQALMDEIEDAIEALEGQG